MEKLGTLICVLLFTAVRSKSASSAPPQPDNLRVSIWDGELTVVWDRPSDVTPLAQYSVEIAKSNPPWMNVSHCTLIQTHLCDVTQLIDNFLMRYRVRVRTVTANGVSEWAVLKKVMPNESQLRPPTFTLRASSSSLTVTVEDKPVLRKLSLYRFTYNVFLEEKGQSNQTRLVYLVVDGDGAEGRSHTFRALYSGREYCVRLQVEGTVAERHSNVSAQQCVRLPDPEWYSMAVPYLSALGVLAVLAVIMAALCSFLRHPEDTPLALKLPEKSWSPLRVGEENMEVVTDKGWLLCTPKAPLEGWGNPGSQSLRPETDWKSERRSSFDSGVSVSSNGATKTGESDAPRQEDSGCVSSGGSHGGEEDPPQPWRTQTGTGAPGVPGQGPQRRGSSSSEGPDSGSGQSGLAADPYRHQGGPVVGVQTWGGGQALKEVRVDPDWTVGDANTDLSGDQPTFTTNYRRKTHIQMETVVSVEDSDSPSDRMHVALEEASPTLFLPLTFLPSLGGRGGLGGGMAPISLSDVELWGE